MNSPTPTLLLILDGWGLAPTGLGNATSLAHTPHMDALFQTCPHSELEASGRAVGLPAGYIGNSEVGHLNIGAGSVVYQDMTRIDLAIERGELDSNSVYAELLQKVRSSGGRLHLAGLLSDGGVHSHSRHLKSLVRIAVQNGFSVFIHCFMDGRDTAPHSGVNYLADLENYLTTDPSILAGGGTAHIASVCGRFYAMDRDTRWERVSAAWHLLVHGQGNVQALQAVQVIQDFYAENITDEFIKPTLLLQEGTWKDGDGVFFFNFRADRMRELVQALTVTNFEGFARGTVPNMHVASMTAYDASFSFPVAFPKESLHMGLGEVVSLWGQKQLRLAETEKYAHVTYFFNGGREEAFPYEERELIPSPRDVDTYDLAPAMSCHAVTDKFIEAWHSEQYSFIVCNLANGDMVGHTGVLSAAVAACEAVDICVGRMYEAVRARKGRMLVIADHGNCEAMLTANNEPQTAHTTNPVPCILVQEDSGVCLKNGKLADVAPTLLALWGKTQPPSMTGKNLVEKC